ncbi:MAG: hypothetical protein ACR2NZ_08295 [Rubripirellula sp.]
MSQGEEFYAIGLCFGYVALPFSDRSPRLGDRERSIRGFERESPGLKQKRQVLIHRWPFRFDDGIDTGISQRSIIVSLMIP